MNDLLDWDEHPDPHDLFVHYNSLYFGGQLGAASVEWSSSRMTRYSMTEHRTAVRTVQWCKLRTIEIADSFLCIRSCAGVCHYDRGGGCRIKLSEPLLKVQRQRMGLQGRVLCCISSPLLAEMLQNV